MAWPNTPPLIVLSGCTWNSTGGAQRPVQLARAFVRLGYPVLYVNYMEKSVKVRDGVVVMGVTDFMSQWRNVLAESAPGVVFVGIPTMWDMVAPMERWTRIVDWCDDWDEFAKAGIMSAVDKEVVRRAVAGASAVTCSAKSLQDLAGEYGAAQTSLVYNAGPEIPLQRPAQDPPGFLRGEINMVYCGCLWGPWIDWDAVARLASDLEEEGGVINVVGGADAQITPRLPQAPNICYHGSRPYLEAMDFVAASDVGLIPFQGEGICRAVDPIKEHDYKAAGIPTVATKVLVELKGRKHCYLADPEHLASAVRRAMKKGRIGADETASYCCGNNWIERGREILRAAGVSP